MAPLLKKVADPCVRGTGKRFHD